LHFSHIGLTDGRTFTLASLSSRNSLSCPRDSALATVMAAATVPQERRAATTTRFGRTERI
jgi:hypothetical protein